MIGDTNGEVHPGLSAHAAVDCDHSSGRARRLLPIKAHGNRATRLAIGQRTTAVDACLVGVGDAHRSRNHLAARAQAS